MRALVACEESQRVTTELRKRGWEAYSCDLQEPSGGRPEWHILGDCIPILRGGCEIRTMDGWTHIIPDKWDMIVAFPPCTHLCGAGQRWFKEGKKDYRVQREAIAFFYQFVMANSEHIAIENPVGVMSSAYRKPDQIINPYEFGSTECKKTCLWLKGLPKLEPTDIVPESERTQGIWKAQFGGKQYSWSDPETKKLRSKTFPGIASAMAEQWTQYIENGDDQIRVVSV